MAVEFVDPVPLIQSDDDLKQALFVVIAETSPQDFAAFSRCPVQLAVNIYAYLVADQVIG